MEKSKRDFLKVSGLCALGLGVLPLAKGIAAGNAPQVMPNPEALKGQKWAMVVDMKKCWEKGKEGCKDCLDACHKVHNVPTIEDPQEEIKWIWTEHYENTFPGLGNPYTNEKLKGKPFIVLCNHCSNPPCVRVCPTQATFKRADGITMMDYHRCIGCRFCMAGCPFGARSFNFREPREYIKDLNYKYPGRERGVVEKCSFCDERLAVGQLPACVESCKVGALVFGDQTDPKSPVRKLLDTNFTIRRKTELGTEPNVYYII
ncbi:MAG: 4Fe-4S dicluster domain-containing protein [Syntrophobacteraceae bacterium]|nr:4Fe-4S dicluster domain-containing protein [Syntrophobacteraceae bacterium]